MHNYYTVVGLKASSPFELSKATSSPSFLINIDSFELFKEHNGIFVADPFVHVTHNKEYLFCELLTKDSKHHKGIRGVIVKLERSEENGEWVNPVIVLEENFHISYPLIYTHNNETYMLVETAEANDVRIYKSNDKELNSWSLCKVILDGKYFDPTIFKFKNNWYMFVCAEKSFSVLELYYSENLLGPWIKHPKSPLKSDSSSSRPAGPILEWENKLYRLAQDCSIQYGQSVKAFEILTITEEDYEEKEVGIILTESNDGWNSHGMHHLQVYKNSEGTIFAVSDGYTKK